MKRERIFTEKSHEIGNHQYVFHGSHEFFDIAIPKRQRRLDKQKNIIFDQISFHATPYRWIALAYTYNPTFDIVKGSDRLYYTMGVDLYHHVKKIQIVGIDSLEASLAKLYSGGGYILQFNREDFFHVHGLGLLELIATKPVSPISIEYVADPVAQMRAAGIEFEFLDAANF